MKKMIAITTALILLVGIIPATPSYAEGEPTISVTLDKNTAQVNDIIIASIRMENMSTPIVIVPLHFNSAVLEVVNNSNEKVRSGVKTASEVRSGAMGVTMGEALEVANWNGAILDNPVYPSLNNENGLLRMMFESKSDKTVSSEVLVTVRFKAIAEGGADIRFATSADTHYDISSPNGAAYVRQEGTAVNSTFVIVEAVQNTQSLTISGTNSTPEPPPVITPPSGSGSGGGGGGGGSMVGGFVATVPAVTPPVENGTINYTAEESLIDEYMARASIETGSSMNIPISGIASEYIIKVPIPAVRKMLESLVMDIIFETPIGLIGFNNYTIIQQSQENSEYAILILSGALSSALTIDQAPAEGLVMGFKADELGTVALKMNESTPVMKSRFDGTYLIFNAVEGNYIKVTVPPGFHDLDTEHWAYGYIQSLVTKNVLNGMNDTTFEPDSNVTREQFAKILVSSLELLDESAQCSFADVNEDDWYYPYVASAVQAGIIQGYADGTFGVEKNITRQEMAVMVSRANLRFPIYEAPIEFADGKHISGWAKEAVQAMQMALIISGFEDSTFRPEDNATRAQAARIVFGVLGVF